MSIELYHHGSSVCSAKVRLALAEKNLAWQSHYVDILRGDQFDAGFLAINPKAVVPVMIHDGFAFRESTVICEYLEDEFPEPALYPRGSRQRAEVRYWTKSVDEELHPACFTITYAVSHRHTILRNGVASFEEFVGGRASEGREARQRKWQLIQEGLSAPGVAAKIRLYGEYLNHMETALRERPWLAGQDLTMADIAMAPYVNRLACLALDSLWRDGRLPGVERWFAQWQARPAFQAALVDWTPASLAEEMRENGRRSWPAVQELLKSDAAPT